MSKKLQIGLIGLGKRGAGYGLLGSMALLGNILLMDNVQVSMICDKYPERIEAAAKRITDKGDPMPKITTSYMDVVNAGLDAIIIATSWNMHVEVAIAGMEIGVPVAMEIGGCYNLDDCWKLVDVYERTKTPIFFLENCCYAKEELLATSLVRNGVLGEVCYCQGYYAHDLRDEIAGGIDTHHYRFEEYKNHNCENYPTHELGPIAKILNIN